MAELIEKTLAEVLSGLGSKSFSSEELTKDYLKEAERLKELNAYITLDPEVALSAARGADEKRQRGEMAPLLGAPIAVKDLILTEGTRTTAASKMLENFVPPYDATVVAKLKSAGAFSVGKANADEFAMGGSNENSYFGPALNPWDIKCVPGGSSGGSAVAVAARLCAGSLGTDTGGSIRQPAAYCGLTGIKPTYGRCSRYGVVAFASSLDQVGPIARDAEDCALILQAISGHDPLDSTSAKLEVPDFVTSCRSGKLPNGKGVKGLRVGIPKEYFVEGLNGDVNASVKAALKTMEELGMIPVEISLPHTEAALAVYYIIAPAEASSNLSRYDGVRYGHRASGVETLRDLYCKTRSEGFGKEVKRRIVIGTYVLSSGYHDAYYTRAQKVRSLIKQDFDNAFNGVCDVIACPTAPSAAFEIGTKTADPVQMYLEDIFTIPVNLAGLPGMSLPCGFNSRGLPIGLQLIGKHWDEATLFAVAGEYQRATTWHSRRPNGI